MPSSDTVAISKVQPWHPPVPREDRCERCTIIDLVGEGPQLFGTFQVVEAGFVFTYHGTPYRHYVDPKTGEGFENIQLSKAPVVTWDELGK